MNRSTIFSSMFVAALIATSACGGSRAAYTSAPMSAAAEPTAAAPAPVERSLFARDPQGQLTEDAIQRLIGSPLELDLPARVGVLPIIAAADWRGPGPDYDTVPVAVEPLVHSLRGTEPFTLVTEMMPIPSGALGMEALREVAARYQLRYILLYREHVAKSRRSNAWTVGYATLVGALFLPGDTLRVDGYVEASLFDVKTGTLLFTVRRRVHGRRTANAWHTDDKLATMRRSAAVNAAPELAKDVRKAVYRYDQAARVENERRFGSATANSALPAAGDAGEAGTGEPAGNTVEAAVGDS